MIISQRLVGRTQQSNKSRVLPEEVREEWAASTKLRHCSARATVFGMRAAEARGVLEVGAHASQDEIRKAYRRAALRWHPDKNPGNTEAATMQFRQVHAAYLALQERAPDEATHTRGNARNENDVQNERQEQQMPTFEDSLRAFHSAFGNAAASSP